MRLCRHACWTWTAADRALPAAAVRPGDGLAGLLSQPQALPRRRPVLVGARHRAARARLAALAGLGRCDDWVAGGDARPAGFGGVVSPPKSQRREGEFTPLRARSR